MSVESGIRGDQQRLVCPNCGKVFFAWRPDDLPGQNIKCHFCKHELADEAATLLNRSERIRTNKLIPR